MSNAKRVELVVARLGRMGNAGVGLPAVGVVFGEAVVRWTQDSFEFGRPGERKTGTMDQAATYLAASEWWN